METFGSGVFLKYLPMILKYAILVVKVLDFNAWMYYSEYNFHMWALYGLKGWYGESNKLGDLAYAASEAAVEANDPFYDYYHTDGYEKWLRMIAYFGVGILGV